MVSLFLLLYLTGCTQPEEPQEIVIGVVWPFASNNSLFNEGIDLAVQEINASGGINGKELKLLKEDDGSEVVKGISIAESLAENKSVRAVIGHRNSFVSLPASAIYEQAGLTMLSPASTYPELTQNNYRYIFRNLPGDGEIASKLAEYLAGQGLRRMVVYYSAEAYGTGLANSFEEHAEKHGITIVDRFNYYSGINGLKRLQSRWQAFGYDGIFIATLMPLGAQFIHDAGQAGIMRPFAAGNTLDSPELPVIGGEAAEGTIVGSVFDAGSAHLKVKSFVNKEEYGYMIGRITSVAKYPATVQSMMQTLGNENLVALLAGQSAPLEVQADLVPDNSTASGYKWSSPAGPSLAIANGTLVQGAIVVAREKPIAKVIPFFRTQTGKSGRNKVGE